MSLRELFIEEIVTTLEKYPIAVFGRYHNFLGFLWKRLPEYSRPKIKDFKPTREMLHAFSDASLFEIIESYEISKWMQR